MVISSNCIALLQMYAGQFQVTSGLPFGRFRIPAARSFSSFCRFFSPYGRKEPTKSDTSAMCVSPLFHGGLLRPAGRNKPSGRGSALVILLYPQSFRIDEEL